MTFQQTYSSGSSGENYQPDKDAGWGLIFRLNALWERADRRGESGNYEGWEIVLDRIFSNLLYRNPMIVQYEDNDEDGEIVNVQPDEKDVVCWKIMKSKIREAKKERAEAAKKRKVNEYRLFHEKVYLAITEYDWWLRKFMQAHGLYLKEFESNPSKALFGGAFKKRRRGGRMIKITFGIAFSKEDLKKVMKEQGYKTKESFFRDYLTHSVSNIIENQGVECRQVSLKIE